MILDDANDAKDADAPDFAGGDMRTASPGIHAQPSCYLPASRRGGEGYLTLKILRWESPARPNTLLKQDGPQLAETSFRDMCGRKMRMKLTQREGYQ